MNSIKMPHSCNGSIVSDRDLTNGLIVKVVRNQSNTEGLLKKGINKFFNHIFKLL